MKTHTRIHNYLTQVTEVANSLDRNAINTLAREIYSTYKKDKNIFIFGNGGSASTSSHFACDLNKGVSYGKKRRFRAISLTDNIATITAYSNDVSYDDVFIEQLKNFLNPGDLVIAISGSGNSKNVIRAVEYANKKGNRTAGLAGYNGGKLKKIAKFSVHANVNDMEISEDIHMILCHTIKNVFMDLLKEEP